MRPVPASAPSSPPRRRRPRGPGRPLATTKAEIEEVALGLFETRGFAATTVDDITTPLDIGRTTLFRYFPTKSAVIWHDYVERVDRLGALLQAVPPEADLLAGVVGAILASSDYTEADRALLRRRDALIADTPQLFSENAATIVRWAEAVAAHIRERAPRGPIADAVAYAYLGAAGGAVRLWADNAATRLDDVLPPSLDVVTHAMRHLLTDAAPPVQPCVP
ncbi:TetR family transcriptional regulator [Streptomyces chlorus]|uniref:TetR family transcriptional regulator n=1 Tax=Streptomyces chlorus TaxID=887452 RepID=A0ABW1E1H8_9ACTN